MDDRILEGFVNAFAEARGYLQLEFSELFEAFVASSILRKYHQVDVEDAFLVGGGGDGGLDVIAILVNGRPARTQKDVDFFVEKMGRLDVEFVFIQAKSSPQFRSSEIGTFVHGVTQFFSPSPTLPFRGEVQQYIDLMNYVYGRSISMQENPRCFLYYATSGTWNSPPEATSRFTEGRQQLEGMNLFSQIHTLPVDAAQLRVTYRDLERGVVREIELNRSTAFPRIHGVDQAYLGLLQGHEFIRLVSNDEGTLNRDLFYDNVRDFQGHNPVNREIEETLNSKNANATFPLLNNGITIVARSINRTGDVFKISDFQIVNGCQTTHILFQNKETVNENMYIPVKLVATGDDRIVTEVIKATNRQTAVLPEALESLTPFHRDLEDFYSTQEAQRKAKDRVYYERRSKQYAMSNIPPKNIVTLTAQTKSFVAMFLNEPHSHPRYYGELLKAYEGRLFANDHNPAAYYASGVGLSRVEEFMNRHRLPRHVRHYKHHMLMLMRIFVAGESCPTFSSKSISEYALKIVNVLRDTNDSEELCQRALRHIQATLKKFDGGSVPPNRLRAFTGRLVQELDGGRSDREAHTVVEGEIEGEIEAGTIKWFDPVKGYGFIVRGIGGDIFFHQSDVENVPWHLREQGTAVRYRRRRDSRRLEREAFMAKEVKIERSG